jgi:hypothetical protein
MQVDEMGGLMLRYEISTHRGSAKVARAALRHSSCAQMIEKRDEVPDAPKERVNGKVHVD